MVYKGVTMDTKTDENKNTKLGRNYVNNTKLYEAFVEWHAQRKKAAEEGKEEPQPPKYISECILLIPKRLINKRNFSGYSFKEEMVDDAIENIIRYYRNFDPTKSKNPFAYFTRIAYNAFIRRIISERQHAYTKYKLIQNSDILNILSTQEHDECNDYHISFIEMMKANLSSDLENYFEGKNILKKKIKSSKSIEDLLEKNSEKHDEKE